MTEIGGAKGTRHSLCLLISDWIVLASLGVMVVWARKVSSGFKRFFYFYSYLIFILRLLRSIV